MVLCGCWIGVDTLFCIGAVVFFSIGSSFVLHFIAMVIVDS